MNPPWSEDWLAVQKQYIDALASFGNSAIQQQSAKSQPNDWQGALDGLWQSILSKSPEQSDSIFSSLTQHSQSWHTLSAQFKALFQSLAGDEENSSAWETTLSEHIEKMKAQLFSAKGKANDGFWQGGVASPLDSWQKQFATLFSTADVSARPFHFAEFQATLEKVFRLPGLDSNHSRHQQTERGLKLWQDYHKNHQAYNELLNKIALASLDTLEGKIVDLGNRDQSISSMRDLYNIWVDSHEESYAEHALTEDYAKRYGNLINSALAFKAHCQEFYSESLQALNLATTDQHGELQQELKDIKQQQAEDKHKIKLLEDKIKQLEVKSPSSKKKKTGQKKVSKLKSSQERTKI